MPRDDIESALKIGLFSIGMLVLLAGLAIAIARIAPEQGFVEVNVLRVEENTIIMGVNCTAIVADTSQERADAIAMGLENITGERPSIYDTLTQVIGSFNITLDKVQVERYDGQFYYAYAFFRTENKTLRIELLPSDGIALSLKNGAPLYVNATLLQEVGRDICL
jgi:bifunctional DNase/RNase